MSFLYLGQSFLRIFSLLSGHFKHSFHSGVLSSASLPTLFEGFHLLSLQLLSLFWWFPNLCLAYITLKHRHTVVVVRHLKLMSKKLCISPFLKLLPFLLWFLCTTRHSVGDTQTLNSSLLSRWCADLPSLSCMLVNQILFHLSHLLFRCGYHLGSDYQHYLSSSANLLAVSLLLTVRRPSMPFLFLWADCTVILQFFYAGIQIEIQTTRLRE